MEKYLVILFLLISLLLACTNAKGKNNQLIEKNAENTDDKQITANTMPNDQPIIIGGHRTSYTLSRDISKMDFFITIGENESADFSGIEQLQNAERLYITLLDTRYVDFSPLRSLPYLEFIEIKGRGLISIPDLSSIPSFTILELRNGRLTNLNGIERLTTLEYLLIADNYEPITDISSLRYLRKLKSLKFYRGFYTIDFFILGNLPELEELFFSGSEEIDLTGIDQLKSIERLRMVSNIAKNIDVRSVYKNIEEIGKMTGLKELYLDESITSIEFLANNVNLEWLELIADQERDDYTTVRLPLDVTPLSNLVNLKHLAIRGFELENAETLKELPNLFSFYTNLFSSLD
jgi:hypothetical protein